MTKLEAVDDIRKALLELILVQDSIADDEEAVQAVQSTYKKLVKRFYRETHEFLAYQQYKAAINDPEYFMQLILLACHYYKDESEGGVLH